MIDTLIACTKCGQEKPPSDYYRNPRNFKRRRACKGCMNDYQIAHNQARAKAARPEPESPSPVDPLGQVTPAARDAAFWWGATPAPIPDDPPFGVTPRMCYQRGNRLYMELD